MSPFFKKEAKKDEAQDWFIPEDGRKHLEKLFKNLKNEVQLLVFTQDGKNDQYNDYVTKFVRDLARLSDKIKTSSFALDSEEAKKHEVQNSPTLLISPDHYGLRFVGAPLGEEGRAFIETILLVSLEDSGLKATAKQILKQLDEPRHVKIFVSPTCPYCPGQVINAFKSVIERPELITAECVDTAENQALAESYNVGSVPHTVINETFAMLGLMPEERFALELVALKNADQLVDGAKGGHVHDEHCDHEHELEIEEPDLVIIGAGPAGLAAGIYAERSGLSTVILEKSVVGGQVAVTPVVENYPGFPRIAGQKLMEVMAQHAREYADIREGESVEEIKIGKRLEIYTKRAAYLAKALIIATGATWKKLGAPGEDRYLGFGVSYCASCDGYMFKGKKVAIVGGGNTALTDALHLKNLGVDVTVIHRRDAFRAEKRLQESIERERIPVLFNTTVEEILGDEKVTKLKLKNQTDGASSELPVDGVFVAVGHKANTELAVDIGLTLDEHGFIKVDRGLRTNIPRIYAAGDVTGGVQQIVTAIGEGSTAALSVFEDISNPYWKKA
jgi:thioredoxin reductase (NADPH)